MPIIGSDILNIKAIISLVRHTFMGYKTFKFHNITFPYLPIQINFGLTLIDI
jgi:hypothetical protein